MRLFIGASIVVIIFFTLMKVVIDCEIAEGKFGKKVMYFFEQPYARTKSLVAALLSFMIGFIT